MNARIKLPIDDYIRSIVTALGANNNLVLVAEPGAGKTTRVPPALLELTDKQIIMLEPRRLAVVSAAQRIAEENNWAVGQEVGYQVRFENKTSHDTQIRIMTEALLVRELLRDPTLSRVGAIVFDEFHERSTHTDLALGLCKELQALERPDLKLIVMSATLDAEPLAQYLEDSQKIHVPGRTFPVEVHYSQQSQVIQTDHLAIENLADRIYDCIKKRKQRGHILVFLPGVNEITRLQSQLSTRLPQQGYILLVLHGSLKLEEQTKVVRTEFNDSNGQALCKVILATNIAESSLTISGVDTVIDTGLRRQSTFSSKSVFTKLNVQRISRASATQRSGRAGREKEGESFRLWTKLDEQSMSEFDIPDIQRSDLSETLLQLSYFGVRDFLKFSWFQAPPELSIRRAEKELRELGFLSEDNELTPLGVKAQKLPLLPRFSKIILTAIELNAAPIGAQIAAILQERDFILRHQGFNSDDAHESDVVLRLKILNESTWNSDVHRASLEQTIKVAHQILENIESALGSTKDHLHFKISDFSQEKKSAEIAKKILFLSFIDRLCRRRQETSSGVMRGQRGVQLSQDSLVKKSNLFVALDGVDGIKASDSLVRLASGVELTWLEEFAKQNQEHMTDDILSQKIQILFDREKNKFTKQMSRCFFELPIEEPRLSAPSTEEVAAELSSLATNEIDLIRRKNSELARWYERYEYLVRDQQVEEELSNDKLLEIMTSACFGETSLEKIFEKDLVYFFENAISAELRNRLKTHAPDRLNLQNGKSVRIQYPVERGPYVEVKIQDAFAWRQNPKIGDTVVTVFLLAPNMRPVQVTNDLAGFWQNGYAEVRKELRARYPKHAWPEEVFEKGVKK